MEQSGQVYSSSRDFKSEWNRVLGVLPKKRIISRIPSQTAIEAFIWFWKLQFHSRKKTSGSNWNCSFELLPWITGPTSTINCVTNADKSRQQWSMKNYSSVLLWSHSSIRKCWISVKKLTRSDQRTTGASSICTAKDAGAWPKKSAPASFLSVFTLINFYYTFYKFVYCTFRLPTAHTLLPAS